MDIEILQSFRFPLFFPYENTSVFLLNYLNAKDAAGRVVGKHVHPYCEIIVVESGSVCYRIGETDYVANRGHVVIIPPHTAHIRTVNSDVSLFAFHCMLQGTENISRGYLEKESQLLSACRDIVDESNEKNFGWKVVVRNAMSTALIRLFRRIMTRSSSINRKGSDPVFFAAMQQINDNIRNDISSSDVASAIGVSQRHLSRLFSNHGLPTPQQYILENKLYLAYSDLVTHRLSPVRVIAHEMGFHDAGYFSKMIKDKFGITPTEIQELDH